MIKKGQLLEHTIYNENYYGTPLKPVLSAMKKGKDVVFDIEVDGASQVKKQYPDSVTIFLKPPSLEELRRRLEGRGTETQEAIEKRLARAEIEMGYADRYDHIIVNDTIEQAASELRGIIESAHEKQQ
jgi:guanylate kinase